MPDNIVMKVVVHTLWFSFSPEIVSLALSGIGATLSNRRSELSLASVEGEAPKQIKRAAIRLHDQLVRR